MESILFHTESLSVGYGGEPVLRDVEIALRPGEILTLLGPNGSGKSTLLKTIIRQLEPMGGAVYLGQKPMESMSENEIARFLSIVMTERIDGEWMNVEDVVSTGRYPYTGRLGILSAADREKAAEAMALTQVAELRERPFPQLSDGQRQRVLLARALCQEPKVLVMDEPTSFLDIRYQLELLSLLRELTGRRNLSVILSLHELELARRISDTVLCLRHGRIDRAGAPETVLTESYIEELYELPPGSYRAYFGATADERADSPPGGKAERPSDGPRYAFFQNRQCEMFPCHKGVENEDFNCLFCYCPLYALGPRCGGNFSYTEKGRKDCTRCTFPHIRENYHAVLARYPEIAELAGDRGKV